MIFLVLALLWLSSVQCRPADNDLKITINTITTLDSVPSGSGLALADDSLYIVSDNSPYFFKLSLATKGFRKVPITGYSTSDYLLPKKTKHDLESTILCNVEGKNCLLAMGSGSSPLREKLLLAVQGNEAEQKIVTLYYLYRALRKRYQLSAEALNVEGTAVYGDRIFLFLRKKNLVISMQWLQFEKYLVSPTEDNVPETQVQHIQLPKHAGVMAGFSGATETDEGYLLFCASLEHTSNSIDDGPIYGSYVGVLKVNNTGHLELKSACLLKDNNGKTIREKIESVAVTGKMNDHTRRAVLISDNDNGASKLFEITIETE